MKGGRKCKPLWDLRTNKCRQKGDDCRAHHIISLEKNSDLLPWEFSLISVNFHGRLHRGIFTSMAAHLLSWKLPWQSVGIDRSWWKYTFTSMQVSGSLHVHWYMEVSTVGVYVEASIASINCRFHEWIYSVELP